MRVYTLCISWGKTSYLAHFYLDVSEATLIIKSKCSTWNCWNCLTTLNKLHTTNIKLLLFCFIYHRLQRPSISLRLTAHQYDMLSTTVRHVDQETIGSTWSLYLDCRSEYEWHELKKTSFRGDVFHITGSFVRGIPHRKWPVIRIFDVLFAFIETSCRTNSRFVTNLICHDPHWTSLHWSKYDPTICHQQEPGSNRVMFSVIMVVNT